MSRIGKLPIAVPAGVKAVIAEGVINVEGPKGKLQYTPGRGVKVSFTDGKLIVECADENDSQSKANYGTTRAILNNMVQGVSNSWRRSLELNGVGYVAKVAGDRLTLTVGYSHDVVLAIPAGVKATVDKTKIDLESADKEVLGTFAAKIRKVNPPEPYLGKGIKYSDEVIRRKAGKAGKK